MFTVADVEGRRPGIGSVMRVCNKPNQKPGNCLNAGKDQRIPNVELYFLLCLNFYFLCCSFFAISPPHYLFPSQYLLSSSFMF